MQKQVVPATRQDMKGRGALSAEIRPDWTIDPATGRTNSSAEYTRLCHAVEQLIRNEAHTLMDGRADSTAHLIVAQLAHVHGMAPQAVAIQGFTENKKDGVLHGTFKWNGRVYRLNAVPLSS